MKHALAIPYDDDDVLFQTGLRRGEFERDASILLAAKLYELGRLSSGRAATLRGMGRVEFLMTILRIGAAMYNLRADDTDDDIRFAQGA